MTMSEFEQFSQLSQARRSMREFSGEPVPVDVLEAVFEAAGYAPSNCNTQPWKVCVVRGDSAEQMKKVLLETIGQHKFQLDFPFDDSLYAGEYKDRQRGAAKLYMEAAGVARDDREQRADVFKRNVTFFDSPQAAFVFMPSWAGVREAADVGMYAQNLMLAMRAHNIGSCPQTVLSFNADAVRAQLGISEEWKLLFGLSFGYFDAERPLNQLRTERASVKDTVSIYG